MNKKQLLKILARRERLKNAFTLPDKNGVAEAQAKPKDFSNLTLDPNFVPQNHFILDQSQFIAAQCSRRAGKSSGLAIRFFRTMGKYAGSTCNYLALTGDSARDIMWPVLEELDERHKLGLRFTPSRLLVTAPNDAKLKLFGADMKNFIKRLKGKKSPGVGIDEAQDFGAHLESLVDDVMTPMLADYTDGWLALTGTPGPVPNGYFFEVTKQRKHNFSNHEWTLLDNPYMPDPKGFLERLIAQKQWADNHPTLLREWRNKWVLDLETLWIRYVSSLNNFDELPKHIKRWNFILGIDIGYKDADAFAVLAWSEDCPEVYLIEEIVTKKQDITSLRLRIEGLMRNYSFHKIVMDTGGLGKKIAEELKNRYGLPIEAADKSRKHENAEFLNDALRLGIFKAREDGKFAQDSYLIQIDWDKSTPDRIVIKKSPHSDIIDAVLYGFKESPAYNYTPPATRIIPGSPEDLKRIQDLHEQSAMEQVKAQINLKQGNSEYGMWKKNKKGVPGWNDWE